MSGTTLHDTITIPRDLFEALTDYAGDLLSEWHWKRDCKPRGYGKEYDRLEEHHRLAVELRDKR